MHGGDRGGAFPGGIEGSRIDARGFGSSGATETVENSGRCCRYDGRRDALDWDRP
jgi:hypothetical protein